MELYQAHLLLRAHTNKRINSQHIWELYIDHYAKPQVTAAMPFNYSMCTQCGLVHEAYTPLPITDGCVQCKHAVYAGNSGYWIMHSNIFFYMSKFSMEDCTMLELALSQLYTMQQNKLLDTLEEVVL